MGNHSKLELMNNRSAFNTSIDNRVKDSQFVNSSSLGNQRNLSQIPFRCTQERFPVEISNQISHESHIDSKGNCIELGDSIKLSRNYQKFHFARVTTTNNRKASLDNLPTLDRILNRTYDDAYDTLSKRIKDPKRRGSEFSQLSRDIPIQSNPNVGPGSYNYSPIRPNTSNVLPLSTSPRFREREPEYCVEPLMDVPSSLSSHGIAKFGFDSRWNHSLYRDESYVKTSGLKLSHERWDKTKSSRIPIEFGKYAKRSWACDAECITTNIDVNPDYGSKITMQTESRMSPMKYSSSFR